MSGLELSAAAQQWVNVVLIWIGLGTITGLVAKLILPIREPASAAGTLVIGVLGSTIGLAALSMSVRAGSSQPGPINPISPVGFFAACVGAVVLMLLYHVLHTWLTRPTEDEATAGE